jgi:hypothetical protein
MPLNFNAQRPAAKPQSKEQNYTLYQAEHFPEKQLGTFNKSQTKRQT